MKNISEELCLKDKLHVEMLQIDLCRVAEQFLVVMDENALRDDALGKNITYPERAKWLRRNIIKPSNDLLAALNERNRPYLSTFPNTGMYELPAYPVFPYIEAEIKALVEWSTVLAEQFDTKMKFMADYTEMSPSLHIENDLRYALVHSLMNVYVNTPNHARGMGPRIPSAQSEKIDGKQQKTGEFIEFIRLAAQPILGKKDQLTDQITLAIKKYRGGEDVKKPRKF